MKTTPIVLTTIALLLFGQSAGMAAVNIADTPLFLTNSVKHNIILGIDDSGSMDSEVVMPTNDGALWWNTTNQSFVGLDKLNAASPGTINFNQAGTSSGTWKKYVYLFPNGQGATTSGKRFYADSTDDHFAVPPRPEYAFARSADYSGQYYNTAITYTPWSSSYGTTYPNAAPSAARYDPVYPTSGTLTLDLTVDHTSSAANETFKLQPGMRNAAGTVVAAATDATFTYYPATFYKKDTTTSGCTAPVPADYIAFVTNPTMALPAGIDALGPDGACLKKYEIKPTTASYPSGRSYADEIQNFANWFTYHRKRHLTTRWGVLAAFANMSYIRTGLFRFNNRSAVTMLDFDTQKATFHNTLVSLIGSGGTPTREALKFAGDEFNRSTGTPPITEACQRNFTMLVTDGYANVASISGIGNEESGMGAPYEDAYSDTLGDIAMYYYKTRLRTDLPAGQVAKETGCPNVRLDCNADLHMNTYAISLWAKGNIYGVTHNNVADAYATPPTWLDPSTSRDPKMVDDLYHAAVNGRGDIFLALTPSNIQVALSAALSDIQQRTASAAAIATNSTHLNTDTVVYQAKFNSVDWTGQLLAYKLDSAGNVITPAAWDSDTTLTSSSTRNIKTYNGSAGALFTWATLTCAQKGALSGDSSATVATNCATTTFYDANASGQNRLNWLRGQSVTGMRSRSRPLGDIVNSDPTFIYRENSGYHLLAHSLAVTPSGATLQAAYADYLNSTSDTLSKTQSSHYPLIFVGANDGMLHAFRADTGVTGSGDEIFAYVPNAVFPQLASLTDPAYSHKYFVDGTVGFGDAYVDTSDGLGTRWRTILVSGLGGGGKAVFALDVTDPGDIKVLWEKDSTSTGYGDLGAMVGTPVIAQLMYNGTPVWVAVFGNGYNSATGKAVLYIANLVTGAVIQAVDVGGAPDNGLGAPAIYNGNGDAYIGVSGGSFDDAIYAADLKGNVWKFRYGNLSGGLTGWESAYASGGSAVPLFKATDPALAQPITSPLEIGAPPTGQTGVMIHFGTGKYFETGDGSTTAQQSLYGIWDNGTRISTTNRSDLQAQSLTQVTVTGLNYRVASSTAVSYPTKRGWYIDLPTSGERVVSAPLLRHGRVIFTTLIPSSNPCLYGGSSWLVEVNATTGANLNYSVFDLDANNLFNTADYVDVGGGVMVPVSGVQYTTGIIKTPAVVSAGEIEYKITSSTSSQINVKTEKGTTGHPRASWREIR